MSLEKTAREQMLEEKVKFLQKELSDLKTRLYREITLYGRITERVLSTVEQGDTP